MANICNFSIQEPEAGDFEFFETSMGQSELQATCNYLARLCLKKTKTETKNSKSNQNIKTLRRTIQKLHRCKTRI